MLNTPVLLIVFNRYDTALQVIQVLRRVKPTKLYIAADGPRKHKPNDAKECAETRKVVLDSIDWDCQVSTRFRDDNVGSGLGPSTAVTWFFEHEEEGIILEDDCVPSESFFSFCTELLSYYRYDDRVMHISGFNIQGGIKRGDASYYFSRYTEVWGWACWRRAWKMFDFEMKEYQKFLDYKGLEFIFPDPGVQKRWIKNFTKILSEKPATVWSYRWMYSIWKENGLCITPNISLTKNIGFDERGVHTKSGNNFMAKIEAGAITEIVHPTMVIPSLEADAVTTALRHHPPLLKRAILKMQYMVKSSFNAS
ncbi:nucleotide-diphospho-sugar transferase [Rhodocytophaga aerolata]|uniref:Nucleotide-diphospho-sugar transferase n=1 Tax=Rhodocytophaga aerolata TaxID=455078 RepID=A0ABT8RGI3_9BACT|nr:nucleotide-diphospho-sugar transferase [Rhodocytophaga aerolata]MDO1451214.1 nucleotide-diphospho-sugar transferase [Rhodocytophaga aerolata]